MKQFLYCISFALLIMACSTEQTEVKSQNNVLEVKQPSNFPEIYYDVMSNQVTEKGFALGKKLFYEGNLSSDGAVSCGFCHQQKFAFTHHGHQFSHGVEGKEGIRNAQPIQNMAFTKEFAWDGATFHLDLFPIIPITNENEMGETVSNVLNKLKAQPDYKTLYGQAFEDGKINEENTFKALSQFMLMMVSSNSKYDKYVRNEPGGTFTAQEQRGLKLFQAKCATCHKTDLFTDDAFRNNGLLPNPTINDIGRMRVTQQQSDKYKFKVPSLRNVELTAPYMHDGRFSSLQSVLNHYSDGVKHTPNLDSLLVQPDGTLGIALKEDEKQDIIAFLFTLTDKEFINDERFSE